MRRNKEAEEKEEVVVEKPRSRRTEKKEDELEWDKKRILIIGFTAIVAIALAIELKRMFLPNTSVLGQNSVKKASEVEKPNVSTPNIDLESKVISSVEDIKAAIGGLDPEEVASSSPQIQKVLEDMQGIKNLPKDEARNTCLRICSGI